MCIRDRAIAKSLSWFNNNLKRSQVNGDKINDNDINIKASDYAEIISEFELTEKTKVELSLATPLEGYSGNIQGAVSESKKIGDIYRLLARKNSITIPLFAFYSVDRSSVELNRPLAEIASNDKKKSRFEVLNYSLKASTKLEGFGMDFIELVNLAEGEKKASPETESLESIWNTVQKTEGLPEDVVKAIESAVKKSVPVKLPSKSNKYQKILKYVNKAIEALVHEVKNLEVDRTSGKSRILVENFGNKVNISQLSQGQKTLLALTGDLAIRLALLNPDLDNPLTGSGVVLIDEIELHLHPRWQQEVLLGLQEHFPNIQFIVTTHSPQVLSTVDNTCIRQICFDDQSELQVKTPQFQTKGVTSADILARIMETNSVPEHMDEAIWLNEFSRFLKSKEKESLEKVFVKIKAHFGSHHPVVVDCESQIRIVEMKARLSKEQ